MRPLPFVIVLVLSAFVTKAQGQGQVVEAVPPVEETVADADAAEPEAPPIALVPVVSEPLAAIATGAPVRLDPYKPAALPRRPPPPSQPAAQARPR